MKRSLFFRTFFLSVAAMGLFFIPSGAAVASVSPPSHISLDVPFTSQAPYGNWRDSRQQDGCEEASLAMARAWAAKTPLTRTKALQSILGAWAWELKYLGGHPSLDATDTARLASRYFGLQATVKKNVTIDDLKSALAAGKLVILPMNGRALGNPHYTAPGPPEHMLVLTGYDDMTQTFTTNDSGTRFGKGYTYSYHVLYDAIREYPTGIDAQYRQITTIKKIMIIISK